MAITIGNKIYVDGMLVDTTDETIYPMTEDVVVEVGYDKTIVYVID